MAVASLRASIKWNMVRFLVFIYLKFALTRAIHIDFRIHDRILCRNGQRGTFWWIRGAQVRVFTELSGSSSGISRATWELRNNADTRFRYGLRGRELVNNVGKVMLQGGGTFGTFMAIGTGLRCWKHNDWSTENKRLWLETKSCLGLLNKNAAAFKTHFYFLVTNVSLKKVSKHSLALLRK